MTEDNVDRETAVVADITKIDYQKLAKLMQERLREFGLTPLHISKELGLSRYTVLFVLRGSRTPSPGLLNAMLSFLEIKQEEIPLRLEALTKPTGKQVFISYSHRDSDYLERLLIHLKPLQRQGNIDLWVDTKLAAGDKWKKEIGKALNNARVAVLLISADFLASDFIIENELPPLLQAAEEKGTLIIPVILKPCRFIRDKALRKAMGFFRRGDRKSSRRYREMVMQQYNGSCHCGAIRFSFEAEPITKGVRCNCSYCSKRGAVVGKKGNEFDGCQPSRFPGKSSKRLLQASGGA